MKHEREHPVLVALRLRPMNGAEYKAGAKVIAHTVDSNFVVLADPNEDPDDILRANRSKEKQYLFDFAFDTMATQEDVYEQTTKNFIQDVLRGFNLTVFAYGPTGAGKTYTMMGTSHEHGIMALALNDLFDLIKANEEEWTYRVTISYVEVYNETVRDLLTKKGRDLDLRNKGSSGVPVVAGVREVEASCTSEVIKLLNEGNHRRISEPTAANHASSRSHAILKITVEQRSRTMDVTQEVRTGKLLLVDLAGSERAAMTKNRGQRMVEGGHINRSLLALSNCINALVVGQMQNVKARGKGYINYRDSKLTRLLKESLGGNCRTVMIAHISPASTCYEESKNTLVYAERSKHIKTKVAPNAGDVSYHVSKYIEIVAELRKKVDELNERQSHCTCTPSALDVTAVDNLCHRLTELLNEQMELREELCTIQYNLVQNMMDMEKLGLVMEDWRIKQHLLRQQLPISPEVKEIELEDEKVKEPPATEELKEAAIEQSGVEEKELTSDNKKVEVVLVTEEPLNDEEREKEPSTQAQLVVEEGKVIEPSASACGGSSLSVNDISVSATTPDVMEPAAVAQVRGELATLVADRQRLEAHRRRLERKMDELNKQLDEHREELSRLIPLPYQKKRLQAMSEKHDLQSSVCQYSLGSAVASLRLTSQDSAISELQLQCSSALDLLDKQCSFIKGLDVATPLMMTEQLHHLKVRQRILDMQVESDKQLSTRIASELPATDIHCSAKLNLTLVNGSKSNLLEESDTDKQSSGDPAPTPSPSQPPPTHSTLRLPGLPHSQQLVTNSWSTTTVQSTALSITQQPSDTIPREPISLPALGSPAPSDGFPLRVDHRCSVSMNRDYKSLPALQNEAGSNSKKGLSKPLLSFTSPPITSTVQYPSNINRRGRKYVVPPTQSRREKPMDVESVKTTSVASLTTVRSNQSTNKQTKRRRQYVARREMHDTAVQTQPKLSQATRKRLREARTVITSNDATVSRLSVSTQTTPNLSRNSLNHHHQQQQQTKGGNTKKTRSNNNNAIPKRRPFVVGGTGGMDRQTRIAQSRVNIGEGNFSSPYLSSVSQHRRTSHQLIAPRLSQHVNRK